eukprot:CAMPEP_0202370436 /NCGR_PEP_ID=MMETSP1127-20130417/2048_1 /ASSEMBLY_ACC=CAM_ASM_000462 /TAXON_ID=3047 /ORGANISM="Dunaliella tertiolecta, Strain CCMP1320" /LENGTH=2277 /DNA_ID=CAMNT_0048966385 /DNA_START=70 /DNA_END=6903 /DNA_ORIENTATION=+
MVNAPTSKEETAPERHALHFHAKPSLDLNTVLPFPATSLKRNVAASCICFHKEKPFLAVSVGTYAAVHDLLSGARLQRIDLQVPIVTMCFSPDGTSLVALLRDWEVVSVEMSAWRISLLCPPRGIEKPVEQALMTIMGKHPNIYYSKYGKEYLQVLPLKARALTDAKGRMVKYKKTPVRMEPAKPIIGLDSHPTELQLLVLHVDGVLRGYSPAGSSANMSLVYSVQIQEPSRALPEPSPFEVHPHPNWVPGGALIIQASKSCHVSVLETAGAGLSSAPSFLLRTHLKSWADILGLGYNRTMSQVFAFGFNSLGALRCASWHLATGPRESSNLSLFLNRVYPFNLMPLVEGTHTSQQESSAAQQHQQADDGHDEGADYDVMGSLWAPSPAWASAGAIISPLSDAHFCPRIARMLVHPVLGTVAVQMQPSDLLQATPALMEQLQCELTVQEQALARRTASVPLLCSINHESHLLGWYGSTVTIQHTPLHAWRPAPGFGTRLQLPGHVFYLGQDACLCKFAAATREGEPLLALPSATSHGLARHPRTIIQGKQGALMIFFELPPQGKDSSDRRSAQDQWQWTLMQPNAFEDTPTPIIWFKPGKYGTFIGHKDAFFAVIEATGTLGAVFHTASTNHANAVPLYTFNLDGCSIAGCAMPLFNGPPSAFQELQAYEKRQTAVVGAIMWQTPKGHLVATSLPAIQGMPDEADEDDEAEAEEFEKQEQLKALGKTDGQAAGNRMQDEEESEESGESDDDELEEEEDEEAKKDDGLISGDDSSSEDEQAIAAKKRAEERALQRKRERRRARAKKKGPQAVALMEGAHYGDATCHKGGLALQPGEVVLQVAWQPLVLAPTGKKARPPSMGAVLTNQRVLLITSLLRLHAAVDLASSSRSAVTQPVTSMLWAGPALLVMTADGRVMQVTWWGSTHPVCHVTPSAGGALVLAGATADALMLLRCVEGSDEREVVYRPVNLLQALVLGWSSLSLLGPEIQEQLSTGGHALGPALARDPAASARAVPNLLNCREVMQAVVAKCDSNQITPGIVWSLLASCAFDLAAVLSSACASMDSANNLAALAAAGRWDKVALCLSEEVEHSLTHPRPPVPGSELHLKLIAAAAGATAHGSYEHALQFLRFAGEWRLALVLAAAHGDFSAVGVVAHHVALAVGDKGLQTSGHTEPGSAVGDAREAARAATLLRTLYSGVGVDASVSNAPLKLVAPKAQVSLLPEKEEDASDAPMLGSTSHPPTAHELASAFAWKLGGSGADLGAEAQAPTENAMRGLINQNELGPIPPTSRKVLYPYLGLDPYTNYALEAAIGSTNPVDAESFSRPNTSEAQFMRSSKRKEKAEKTQEEAGATNAPATKVDELQPAAWGPVGALGGVADEPSIDGSNFDDSDWEDGMAAPSQKKSLKIQIRSKEEMSGQTADLRKAAGALKLPPPGSSLTPQGSSRSGAGMVGGSISPQSSGMDTESWFGGPPPVKAPPPGTPTPDIGNPFGTPDVAASAAMASAVPLAQGTGLSPRASNQHTGLTPQPSVQHTGLTPTSSVAPPAPQQPAPAAALSGGGPDPGDDLLSFFAPNTLSLPPPQPQQPQPPQQQQQAMQPPALRAGMSPALQAGLSPALQKGLQPQQPPPQQQQQQQQQQQARQPPALRAGMSPALQAGLSPALQQGSTPQPPQPQPQPKQQQAPFTFPTPPAAAAAAAVAPPPPQPQAGMSPALQAGLSPALRTGLSPQTSATQQQQQQQQQQLMRTPSAAGLSPALQAGLSPALSTGLTPQPSATQQPPAAPPAYAAPSPQTSATHFQQQQQLTRTPSTAGLSPALQAGLAPRPPAQQATMPPALRTGMSPALQQGLAPAQPQPPNIPASAGLSPALQAGLQQQQPQQQQPRQPQVQPTQPQPPPPQPQALAARGMPPAHQPGMSPALQAGLATTQPKSNIPAARGLSPALRAGLSPALQQGLASTTATAAAPPQPPLQQVQPPTPTSAPPPQQPQQNAQQLYFAGAAQLEAGNWGSAEGTFTRALEQLAQQPSGPGRDKQLSFCAQYLAAVKLLGAASSTPPGSADARAARLYRYAASLGLDRKHQLVLMRESITRNKACKNFRYAAEQLTNLITNAVGSAPESFLTRLQTEIEECDRLGTDDASVPHTEQLDSWASIVAASSSASDVSDAVEPLLSAAADVMPSKPPPPTVAPMPRAAVVSDFAASAGYNPAPLSPRAAPSAAFGFGSGRQEPTAPSTAGTSSAGAPRFRRVTPKKEEEPPKRRGWGLRRKAMEREDQMNATGFGRR